MRRRAPLVALWVGLVAAGAAGEEPSLPPVGSARAVVMDVMPRGPGLEERLAEIRRRIQEALVYPPLARWRGQTGVASVAFEIAADGQAREVRTLRSSGVGLLDRAAERAVAAAAPLPRVLGPLEVPVRFELD